MIPTNIMLTLSIIIYTILTITDGQLSLWDLFSLGIWVYLMLYTYLTLNSLPEDMLPE